MAEILITGGAGNLGRSLARALRDLGHGLRIVDLPSCDFSYFDGWGETRIFPGDILDRGFLSKAVDGADRIVHLAAILPPASEVNRERTFRVNVEGTRSLIDAASLASSRLPTVIFASSVSVYGDTSQHKGRIGPDHPVRPNDWYAQSKVEAEAILKSSDVPYVNLRISAIVIPAFLDPPEPWPFQREQRIELVALSDLVRAMVRLAGTENAAGRTLILAGGRSWQVTGGEYVQAWGDIMAIPLEEMSFLDRPGWLNWYDTGESEALLEYQKTTLDGFFTELKAAVAEAMG
jgi:nucleoside-diphosphate-sugar epimerase